MSLRQKTVTLISITVIALIVILFVVINFIVIRGFNRVQTDLLTGFNRIEQKDTRRNIQRVVDALESRLTNLSVKATDWAMWDDTWHYIKDHNSAFAESNLDESALLGLKINLLMIYDTSGNDIFSMAFDLESGAAVPIPSTLKSALRADRYFFNHQDSSAERKGILMLAENPLLLVSRPVVHSNGSGPIRGSVLFGRFLDKSEINDIARVTHLAITCERLDNRGSLPIDFANAIGNDLPIDSIRIIDTGADTIAGYTIMADYAQKSAVAIRVHIARDIHRQGLATAEAIKRRGETTLTSLMISIILAGLVLATAILVLMSRSIVSRLELLSRQAASIGTTNDFNARVDQKGNDEISVLGGSLNAMLSALAASHMQISGRNAEMALLMNTIPSGLISLDKNNLINPEYSAMVETIFDIDNIRGREFADLLGLVDARSDDKVKLYEFFDVLRMEILSDKELAALNPFEEFRYQHNETQRWLRLRYYLIQKDDQGGRPLLVIVEDITEEKKLAEQASISKQENVQLKAIAENPDLFREFLVETRQILRHVEKQISFLQPQVNCREQIAEIFRGVHTIKGVAGSFGLFSVSELSGKLENFLSPIRESTTATQSEIAEISNGLVILIKSFEEVLESSRRFLVDDLDDAQIYLRISLNELKRHIVEIQNMAIEYDVRQKITARFKDELITRLRTLKTVPALKGFARSLKIIPNLIENMQKKVNFTFDEGKDLLIDCELANELNNPLIHLIRNALDHGIEAPDERIASGKRESGQLMLKAHCTGTSLQLTISDDGRGLDPQRIAAKAIELGLYTPSQIALLDNQLIYTLIFVPGFTTKETITDISGRGVGMDVVKEVIEKRLHGTISIESNMNRGTTFTIEVPWVC